MLSRPLDAGVPAARGTGETVDGADPGLRAEVEIRGTGAVLAVACDHRVVAAGREQTGHPSPSKLMGLICNGVQQPWPER